MATLDMMMVGLLFVEQILRLIYGFFFFLKKEFQLMASAPNNSSLSTDQDTNQFLV